MPKINVLKKIVVILGLSLVGLNLASSLNAEPMKPTLNKENKPEFKLLNPVQETKTGQKIEILELFSYGCPHCFELEPELNEWKKKLPADVQFRRFPVVFREDWIPLAKIYFTLEAMNLVEKYHAEVFNDMHLYSMNLSNPSELSTWLKQQKNINEKQFMDIFNSFAIQSKIEQSRRIAKSYQISGVPSLVINGKYLTSGSMALGYPRMFEVMNLLIKSERQEKKK